MVDIVIASSNTGNAFIKKNQYIHITELKPSLEKIDIYHYVHKNLVPKIDRIIKEMIKNNEIKKIIKELILSSK
ncbi:MAG: transporter substrate-binding domain-containing protein [Campylobacterales bacterium]|nr:transporter substrate-binding domain-containing protein [Campylobacterales bacterium]